MASGLSTLRILGKRGPDFGTQKKHQLRTRDDNACSTAQEIASKVSAADLRGSDLSSANLTFADLHDANLRGARLENVFLSNASLKDTDLVGTDLSGSDLSQTDLSGADLRSATLYSVKWKEIRSIRSANIADVKGAPEGFIPWTLANGAVQNAQTED